METHPLLLPEYFLLTHVRPVDFVVGDFHIQSNCVFEMGDQAGVLAAIHSNLPDFVAIGKKEVCNGAW